jgi:hypothetical protein
MEKKLTKHTTCRYWGDLTGVSGDLSRVWGDITRGWGDLTGVRGDLTGVCGDLSGVCGDVDECELTTEDRAKGVDIDDLIDGGSEQ